MKRGKRKGALKSFSVTGEPAIHMGGEDKNPTKVLPNERRNQGEGRNVAE